MRGVVDCSTGWWLALPMRAVALAGMLAGLLALSGCGQSSSAPDFSSLVKRVSPSVVNITATTVSDVDVPGQPASSRSSGQPPGWARQYLDPPPTGNNGDGNGGGDGDGDYGQSAPESTGSGFVLWPNGYILTNEHVVAGSNEVTVRLSDGRQLLAKVVGMDRPSDIALLKIDADHLHAVHMADDKKLEVGQWVLAIGSPFGFDYSVTAGIVSAVGRDLSSEQYVPFIQTDAAINPGNSGGPLFNMKGQVVGINSQIYSQTGGFMGVAFAIPIDVAVKVARELKTTGHVRRGWMGVVVQEVTRKLAMSFGLKVPHGALVTQIIAGGPAADAGLRVGDVLLAYNKVRLNSSRELPPLVGSSSPGQTVTLKLLRDHHVVEVRVQLGQLKLPDASGGHTRGHGAAKAAPRTQPPSSRARGYGVGLELRAASSADLAGSGVTKGLVIKAVGPGAARDAGLEPGDVIVSVKGEHLATPTQFKTLMQGLTPGSSVPVLVQRDGGPMFLGLQIPDRP